MVDTPAAPPVVVRRLGASDACAYKTLRDRALRLHPSAFTSDAAEEAARTPESYLPRFGIVRPDAPPVDDACFTLGAWSDTALIGALGSETQRRAKVRHVAHLVGMIVEPDRQSRGVGRALLEAGLDALRATGTIGLVTLTVTAGNRPAIRLYESAGFVRCGTLPRAIYVDGVFHAKDTMMLLL